VACALIAPQKLLRRFPARNKISKIGQIDACSNYAGSMCGQIAPWMRQHAQNCRRSGVFFLGNSKRQLVRQRLKCLQLAYPRRAPMQSRKSKRVVGRARSYEP
jgi:hypothetical protein